jgi:hypothetical protein
VIRLQPRISAFKLPEKNISVNGFGQQQENNKGTKNT